MLHTVKNYWATSKKIRQNQIHQFETKVEISIERGPFLIKTVTSKQELLAALRLRHQVFFNKDTDFGPTQIDVDEFDSSCDHLVIIDQNQQKIVGTYRLNCSLFTEKFYSATEYDLTAFSHFDVVTLELGRACIQREYRKGAVIALLWRGIAEYMHVVGAEILFGCTSIKSQAVYDATLIYKYFSEKNAMSSLFFCEAIGDFKIKGFRDLLNHWTAPLTAEEIVLAESIVPPLFHSYLKAGAVLCSEPAIDTSFKSIDFLTCLRRSDLGGFYRKKYGFDA